jgi:hypothetical protein
VRLSEFIHVDRNPWIGLSLAVSLSLTVVVLRRNDRLVESDGARSIAAFEAARLAGASRSRARALGAPWQRRRWLGLFILLWAFAATNVSPALLFTPWTDGRTVGPGILELATGTGDSQAQAAALALCVVPINILALAFARLTSALPPTDS